MMNAQTQIYLNRELNCYVIPKDMSILTATYIIEHMEKDKEMTREQKIEIENSIHGCPHCENGFEEWAKNNGYCLPKDKTPEDGQRIITIKGIYSTDYRIEEVVYKKPHMELEFYGPRMTHDIMESIWAWKPV